MERHRTDVVSLLFGLLFAGTAAGVLLGVPLGFLWSRATLPVLLILVGVWVLATVGGDGQRRRAEPEHDSRDREDTSEETDERTGQTTHDMSEGATTDDLGAYER